MKRRLFIAIPADARLRRALLDAQRAIPAEGCRVRWTREDHFHLTVKFLGDTPDERLADVIAVLRSVAAGTAPFAIRAGGGGCFPPAGAVRVIWIGGDDPDGKLGVVVQQLESGLEPLGIAREPRTFSIHFTLGRVKSDGSRGRLRSRVEALQRIDHDLAVRELMLFESRLGPAGPAYDVVHREPLST